SQILPGSSTIQSLKVPHQSPNFSSVLSFDLEIQSVKVEDKFLVPSQILLGSSLTQPKKEVNHSPNFLIVFGTASISHFVNEVAKLAVPFATVLGNSRSQLHKVLWIANGASQKTFLTNPQALEKYSGKFFINPLAIFTS